MFIVYMYTVYCTLYTVHWICKARVEFRKCKANVEFKKYIARVEFTKCKTCVGLRKCKVPADGGGWGESEDAEEALVAGLGAFSEGSLDTFLPLIVSFEHPEWINII